MEQIFEQDNSMELDLNNNQIVEVAIDEEQAFEPVAVELAVKPPKLECLNIIDGVKCTRKAIKSTNFCRKCTKTNNEQKEEESKQVQLLDGKETAVNALFGMHYAMYLNFQLLGKLGGVDLDGLPDDLVRDQDQIKRLYEQIYLQYGPEALDNYVGPVYALALMAVGQVGGRYIQNQKKE